MYNIVALTQKSAHLAWCALVALKLAGTVPCTGEHFSYPVAGDSPAATSFVKTMKEDYIAFMPKPNVRTALQNLAEAFNHYNENHPHSALGYHSPREYRRLRASLT